MINIISLNNKKIKYSLNKSWRAKRLRISIGASCGIKVTVPFFCTQKKAENFLYKKADWVLKSLHKIEVHKTEFKVPKRDKRSYQKHKEEVREYVKLTLEKYSRKYGLSYNRIAIKNQKTRWGSCSQDHNININYRIKYLPARVAEYIVVHELCHIAELNHSKNFWKLVGKTFPDYKKIEKKLRGVEV
ncbi:MAG: SprT family zinc-dependent metalloprotease [bacterium]